jgi:hypothetical protein
VKVLPFELICPIPWDRVGAFEEEAAASENILNQCVMVMLSNASLKTRAPALRQLTCQQIGDIDNLAGAIMRAALRGKPLDDAPADPPSSNAIENFLSRSWLARLLFSIPTKSHGEPPEPIR